MSLLLNVIYAAHAQGTHHKLALDALRHVDGTDASRWINLILSHHSAYLTGSKAPDDDFRDFRNHVLHVHEDFWGGAVDSVHHWYGQLIDHLRGEEWKDAAYAAGVLSHYFSDPHMPFHTAQSESEGAVHRAAEWSVSKSYESLRALIQSDLGGYPQLAFPSSDDWLGDMVRAGAIQANAFYESLIDHYNLEVGVKNPPAGLDDYSRKAVAKCLAHATVGLAMIFERAFEESAVVPPDMTMTLPAILATVNVPIRQVLNKMADMTERKEVDAIYREVQDTGKAVQSLPESEKLVRQFHAAEVRKIPLAVLNREQVRVAGSKWTSPNPSATEPTSDSTPSQNVQQSDTRAKVSIAARMAAAGASVMPARIAALATRTMAMQQAAPKGDPLNTAVTGTSATAAVDVTATRGPVAANVQQQVTIPIASTMANSAASRRLRVFLKLDSPIVDAPSIGPKTATRFHELQMPRVSDLLQADVNELAAQMNVRHITADVLREWQDQSRLMIRVPGLRGHDAQLLVAAGVRDRMTLRRANADDLTAKVQAVAETAQGRSILRESAVPDVREVTLWIEAAGLEADSGFQKAG
jgi:hypothetical protein